MWREASGRKTLISLSSFENLILLSNFKRPPRSNVLLKGHTLNFKLNANLFFLSFLIFVHECFICTSRILLKYCIARCSHTHRPNTHTCREYVGVISKSFANSPLVSTPTQIKKRFPHKDMIMRTHASAKCTTHIK